MYVTAFPVSKTTRTYSEEGCPKDLPSSKLLEAIHCMQEAKESPSVCVEIRSILLGAWCTSGHTIFEQRVKSVVS